MKTIHLLLLSTISLTACQKAVDEVEVTASLTGAPGERHFGDIPADLDVEYDEVAETFTITNGDVTHVLSPYGANPSLNGFLLYSGVGGIFAALRETDSGDGYAGFMTSIVGGDNFAGSIFGREENTTLTQSGSATFTGSYAGIVVADLTGSAGRLVEGDVELNANLDSLEISGLISNRAYGGDDPLPYNSEDVFLQSTTIDANLEFSGTTSGGALTDTSGISSAGSYSGMFVGADGQETVGGLMIPHESSAGYFTEFGAFIGAAD